MQDLQFLSGNPFLYLALLKSKLTFGMIIKLMLTSFPQFWSAL